MRVVGCARVRPGTRHATRVRGRGGKSDSREREQRGEGCAREGCSGPRGWERRGLQKGREQGSSAQRSSEERWVKTQGRLPRRRRAPVPYSRPGLSGCSSPRYTRATRLECSGLECSRVGWCSARCARRARCGQVGPFWAASCRAQPECSSPAAGGAVAGWRGGPQAPLPCRRPAQRAPAMAAAAAAPPIIACWCCAAAVGCAAAAAAWLACMAMARPLARFWSRYSLVPSRTRTPFCSNSRIVSCAGAEGWGAAQQGLAPAGAHAAVACTWGHNTKPHACACKLHV